MLYCLQIAPTKEAATEGEIVAIVPRELYGSIFHLTRKRWRKYHGSRHIVTERMMPGYVFIDSDRIDELYEYLKQVPALTKLLNYRTYDPEGLRDDFAQLDASETAWIRHLAMGEGAAAPGMIDISGVELQEGGKVRVVHGPLVGMEEQIRRIDLHRGVAYLGVEIFGREVDLLVGVEDLERIR